MAIIAGKEAAEQLLVHTSSGSLHHYSMNTDSLDVVGLYLNEMPEKHSKNIEVWLCTLRSNTLSSSFSTNWNVTSSNGMPCKWLLALSGVQWQKAPLPRTLARKWF